MADKKVLAFPKGFIWGTSTAAYQIETAFEHDWKGVESRDGYVFDRTSDHEKRFDEDAEIISSLAPAYRMSMQWSKLQREPFGEFDAETVAGYKAFLDKLKSKGQHIMLVLHHFTNPLWFVQAGGWETEKTRPMFLDYVKRFVDVFGSYADTWNTFNEPGVYASNGWLMGNFPPFKKNLFKARRVVKNLGKAHDEAYDIIKAALPEAFIGISKNTVCFVGEHILGHIPAKIADYWFMDFIADQFTKVDFLGMSYYTKMPFVPGPLTAMDNLERMEKLGKAHDDMWEYYPEGIGINIKRYWQKYKKPIIITENGVCTGDDPKREQAIKDYLQIIHQLIQEGVDIRGYFFWSTFDNFEWNLGPTYKFGLYQVDFETGERTKRPSADLYSRIAFSNTLEV